MSQHLFSKVARAGLLLTLLGGLAQAQAQTAPVQAPPVAAAPAKAASPERAYSIERRDIRAQLLPRRYTTLAAEIGAKIDLLPFSEAGSFKAGQVLVRFECSVQQAQWSKAKAELDGAQTTLDANERLFQLNSIGQLELDLSRSAVRKASAEVKSHQAVLAKCDIKAPFAGRVAEQKAREQQYVQPGQAVLEIIEDTVLELEFLVPSYWLTWLKPGGKFQVTIDETGKTYPARFIRLGARVDPVSQSVKVAAAIEGRQPELMAGMGGRVLITPPAASSAPPTGPQPVTNQR